MHVGVLGILGSTLQVGHFVERAPFLLEREEMKPCLWLWGCVCGSLRFFSLCSARERVFLLIS